MRGDSRPDFGRVGGQVDPALHAVSRRMVARHPSASPAASELVPFHEPSKVSPAAEAPVAAVSRAAKRRNLWKRGAESVEMDMRETREF